VPILKYSGGSASLSGLDISAMPKSDVADNIGVVSQHPFIFAGSIRDNLLYSLNARREAHGITNEAGLPTLDELIAVVQQVGLFTDILRFALNSVFKKGRKENLVKKIIRIRQAYQTSHGEALADSVEFFDPARYLYYSSVAENLLFGTPEQEDLAPENLAGNPRFIGFLHDCGLKMFLLQVGAELANRTVDILKDVPSPEAIFFERTPIDPEEFEDYRDLVGRLGRVRLHKLPPEDERRLLTLALRFTPGRHAIVTLSPILEGLLLQGRAMLAERIAADAPGAVTFFRREDYLYSMTLMDNILFGRVKSSNPKILDQIQKTIVSLLIEEDMLERVLEIGLDFQVGSMGDRLSGGQRQKVAIARAFLREPPILILDEATAALDNASQARIQNLLETKWKGKSTIISVVHRLDTIVNYDKVAVMKAGRIVETGTYAELMERQGVLHETRPWKSGKGVNRPAIFPAPWKFCGICRCLAASPWKASRSWPYLAVAESFSAGEVLLGQGEKMDAAYFLLDGEVAVSRRWGDTEKHLYSREQGAFLGGLGLLAPAKSLFSVRAVTDVCCLVLGREKFLKTAERFPGHCCRKSWATWWSTSFAGRRTLSGPTPRNAWTEFGNGTDPVFNAARPDGGKEPSP